MNRGPGRDTSRYLKPRFLSIASPSASPSSGVPGALRSSIFFKLGLFLLFCLFLKGGELSENRGATREVLGVRLP